MNSQPFVVCFTNTVAANFTANVLLAIGAKPAMIEEPSEAAELAPVADALLINVGTLTEPQAATMLSALDAIDPRMSGAKVSMPWVLDPVACQCLSFRRRFIVERLLPRHPTLIRGNRDEIDFLRASCATKLEGVPLLSTGVVDRIYAGDEFPLEIAGGVAMLQQVTATGCAQGAICAALLGRGLSPREAAISASRLLKQAGERAYRRGPTPGSFQMALLDELAALSRVD